MRVFGLLAVCLVCGQLAADDMEPLRFPQLIVGEITRQKHPTNDNLQRVFVKGVFLPESWEVDDNAVHTIEVWRTTEWTTVTRSDGTVYHGWSYMTQVGTSSMTGDGSQGIPFEYATPWEDLSYYEDENGVNWEKTKKWDLAMRVFSYKGNLRVGVAQEKEAVLPPE